MIIHDFINKINKKFIIYNNDKGYFINQRIVVLNLGSLVFIKYQRKSKCKYFLI